MAVLWFIRGPGLTYSQGPQKKPRVGRRPPGVVHCLYLPICLSPTGSKPTQGRGRGRAHRLAVLEDSIFAKHRAEH